MIVFDIETCPIYQEYGDLPERYRLSWDYHCERRDLGDPAEAYERWAGLDAIMSKVVCISTIDDNDEVRSFYGNDERRVLARFSHFLMSQGSGVQLGGHYILGFDIPFLLRRMLIHGIHIPTSLDIRDRKPWELKHIVDSYELWRMNTRSSASLVSLCVAFGIPSPKDDISGADVKRVWYSGDHERVVRYCEADVIATKKVIEHL
ncbi:MAG: 3'-5' exonuclease [Bacteroidetes bacterium]|nr:MAG: 3'-5' exonuclease [Bacteroidota bacterium]